jgi:hypothetical protein
MHMTETTTPVGALVSTPPTTATKTIVCPDWCESHRYNSSGWQFHLSKIRRAGGLIVAIQQNVRVGNPTITIFDKIDDDSPTAVMDTQDGLELLAALAAAVQHLEAIR